MKILDELLKMEMAFVLFTLNNRRSSERENKKKKSPITTEVSFEGQKD